MTNKYYDAEIRKLELQRKNLKDQYNTLDENQDLGNTSSYTPTPSLAYSPSKDENLKSYFEKLKIYRKINYEKNIKCHINTPKGAWYSHRAPQGCFMCEDQQMINVMTEVIRILSLRYPSESLTQG